MTKRTRRLLWIGIPVAAVLLGLNAMAPLVYFTKPIDGRIIDAETGQPLEGVVVVARSGHSGSHLDYGLIGASEL